MTPSRSKTVSLLATAAMFVSGVASAQNWLMDGGDNIRSGWNQNEHILTKGNIKSMKLLWSVKTDVVPHALHTLMGPLVVQDVPTAAGKKEMVYVLGSSDELYAFDTSTHKLAWTKHFKYDAPPAREQRPAPDAAAVGAAAPGANSGRPGGAAGGPATPAAAATPPPDPMRGSMTDPKHYNFLNPQGSTGVPAIGPEEAGGIRPIYVVDGGGVLHTLSDVTGESLRPDLKMGAVSKFALQLYRGEVIYAVYAGKTGILSTKADGTQPKPTDTKGFGGGGGLWGRRGPVISSDGTVWTTTGDGLVNLKNPANLVIGNSVVGFKKSDDGKNWVVKDWYTPPNWDWLRRRDLDPNNTPTVFNWHGKEYIAASGKECRIYLLDPKNVGGADHQTPMFKTPLVCNEIVDFQNAGSWGALSSWEDAKGTRWVLMPFWGPKHSQMHFPIENTPETKEGGQAAFKMVEKNGKAELEPVWVSRDMHRGEPNIIANGMVFSYGSGESSQQSWNDIGLNFDSSIRASHGEPAVIYVLDAETGKELWNSGDCLKAFNHFSSITVANGKVYIGTYDGMFYCFGLS
ncbi:MAG: PQQ-binding-like beta-propeller repeat protein [Janthinobacterium lividum]